VISASVPQIANTSVCALDRVDGQALLSGSGNLRDD